MAAEQPHPLAIFDPMWRSRHDPAPYDGWRFSSFCDNCEQEGPSVPVVQTVATAPQGSVQFANCPDCEAPPTFNAPIEPWRAPDGYVGAYGITTPQGTFVRYLPEETR